MINFIHRLVEKVPWKRLLVLENKKTEGCDDGTKPNQPKTLESLEPFGSFEEHNAHETKYGGKPGIITPTQVLNITIAAVLCEACIYTAYIAIFLIEEKPPGRHGK